MCVCVFIRTCQTKEEVFFPVSASVCLCQTLCVRLAGHFDLVFEIQGFVEVGNESKVGMSVRQDNRFIVFKKFWVEKRKMPELHFNWVLLVGIQILFPGCSHPGLTLL